MANEVTFSAGIKPWYKSKIVLFALSGASVFLTVFLTSKGIDQEQMDVIRNAYPKIAEAIQGFQRTKDYLSLFGAFLSAAIGVFRVWYTKTIMPESIPAK